MNVYYKNIITGLKLHTFICRPCMETLLTGMLVGICNKVSDNSATPLLLFKTSLYTSLQGHCDIIGKCNMHCSKNPPYHLFRTMTVVVGNAVPGELGHRGISTHISYVLLAILSHPFICVTTPLNCLTHAPHPFNISLHPLSFQSHLHNHALSSPHPLSYTATPAQLSNCTHSAA